MKKFKVLAVLMGIILFASSIVGCGQPVNLGDNPGSGATEGEDESIILTDPPVDIECDLEVENIGGRWPIGPTAEELTEGLTENEYPDLVIEAVVLERMAILPGNTIRVSVTVTNQGEETVSFIKGSGTNEIPEALVMLSDDLQPIMPKDRMGIATMDFVVETIEPGETLNYSLFVRAIKPNEYFDSYTFQLFGDGMTYIGDVDWETLAEEFPSLSKVSPGPHSINIYFLYAILRNEEPDLFGLELTGFNTTTLEIVVD
jgi:hypothetical protein